MRLHLSKGKSMTPLDRVPLHERADFFAEVWKNRALFLGMRMAFMRHTVYMPPPFPTRKTRSSTANATIRSVTAMAI